MKTRIPKLELKVGRAVLGPPPVSVRAAAAFTLVEIIITVGLLAFIMIGLLAMFNQVQRAFRVSTTQTDVLEGGRAIMELITREMEQTTPTYRNFGEGVNFYANIPAQPPVYQTLPNTTARRTNFFEDVFFMYRENQAWNAIGYRVSTPADGVGTLYRYSLTTNTAANLYLPFFDFTKVVALTNLSRLMDGVVHFRVQAYDLKGILLTNEFQLKSPNNADIRYSTWVPDEIGLYSFTNGVVPAYVELELGILEQQTYERYKAIASVPGKLAYLERNAGHVHLFRRRIPIRNVDPAVYP